MFHLSILQNTGQTWHLMPAQLHVATDSSEMQDKHCITLFAEGDTSAPGAKNCKGERSKKHLIEHLRNTHSTDPAKGLSFCHIERASD